MAASIEERSIVMMIREERVDVEIGDLSNTETNRTGVVGGGRICHRSEPMVKY